MTCRICGNAEKNKDLTLYEKMYGTLEAFPYVECGKCGSLQIRTVPADLGKYYPRDYYSYARPSPLRGAVRKWLRSIKYDYIVFNRGRLGKLLYDLKPGPYGQFRCLSRVAMTKASRFLDVGCGSGRDLHKMREMGMENLLGVDPHLPEDIRYENGLTVQKKDFLEVGGTWDVILFNHVMEHLPDPHGVLRHVRTLLAPGGVCIVRGPVVPCYAWEHYGTDWLQLDAPRHLFIFSVEGMRILARENGLSFSEDRYYYDSVADQFWGSELYARGLPLVPEGPKPKKIFSAAELKSYRKKARELNIRGGGDQAVFYLARG